MGTKKNINKIIVGTFLGTAIGGLGFFSRTKKGKGFFAKLKNNLNMGFKEMGKTFKHFKKTKDAKKKK